MSKNKTHSLKKNVALVAGAALATTAAGATIHTVNVHADTVNTTQAQTSCYLSRTD